MDCCHHCRARPSWPPVAGSRRSSCPVASSCRNSGVKEMQYVARSTGFFLAFFFRGEVQTGSQRRGEEFCFMVVGIRYSHLPSNILVGKFFVPGRGCLAESCGGRPSKCGGRTALPVGNSLRPHGRRCARRMTWKVASNVFHSKYIDAMFVYYILCVHYFVFIAFNIFHESHIYTIIVYNYLMFECFSKGSEGEGERWGSRHQA